MGSEGADPERGRRIAQSGSSKNGFQPLIESRASFSIASAFKVASISAARIRNSRQPPRSFEPVIPRMSRGRGISDVRFLGGGVLARPGEARERVCQDRPSTLSDQAVAINQPLSCLIWQASLDPGSAGVADAAGIQSGPIFRPINKSSVISIERLTNQSVALIVKRYAGSAGLDAKQLAGHSLRVGFLTSAAAARKSIFKMMDVSRHKSVDTLRGYVRDAELFKDHAGAGLL